MALKRLLQLKISDRQYMVGFNNYVRTRLTPRIMKGTEAPPEPDSVRKILKGERASRRLLLDIFQNGTDLMRHPCVDESVKKVFEHWQKTGELPEDYGTRKGRKKQ